MSLRICSFESRRGEEMANLIRKFQAEPTIAPSMREIPLTENPHAREFADRLLQGEFPIVIFMTGVGAATLFEAVRAIQPWEPFQAELDRRTIIVRGPKPVPVLKQHHLHIDFRAPEPNTWRELLTLIDAESIPVAGTTVAIQEYGKPSLEFYAALEARGATVFAVPVYRWDFPLDVEPLYAAIRTAVAQPFDVVMFTSANQVDNVLEAAEQISLRDEFCDSLTHSVLASIGPTCSERMAELGLTPTMEPSHPKMAHLVRESIEHAQRNS